MLAYVLRRALYTGVVMIAASIVIFLALRVSPGQPEDTLFNPLASPAAKQALRRQFHLDRPIVVQYGIFVDDLLHGDLGTSIKSGDSIPTLIRLYGVNSLQLELAAIVITYGLAIPLGVLVATKRDSSVDHGVMMVANLGMGVPNFLLALILIRFLAVQWNLLPLSGTGGVSHLVLPALALAAEGVSVTLRLVRSSMLEQLGQDYVRTLRAKGLARWRIVWLHALRNALIPVISLSALNIGALVGYTAIVEIVFRYPGLGQLLVNSVLQRDYPVALMLSLLLTFCVIIANFVANVAYAFADPRIRTGAARA
jgi:peptide/nickel transport system permease protein